ncbi:MAG TPA: hypothetical protein EYN11_05400 [Phycisphaerales bacterium]|nr:hypothetical protein [Phycisphaerales bacterium]HIO52397.1 hypothetical protein [Phycisphaerales bacterium]
MYYVEEIVDRTFENWSTMLGAKDHSFWSNSEIEMKPTTDADTSSTTSTPAETPAWEPTVTSEWNEDTQIQDAAPSTSTSESTSSTDPVRTTLQDFKETVSETLDDINPFSDRDRE